MAFVPTRDLLVVLDVLVPSRAGGMQVRSVLRLFVFDARSLLSRHRHHRGALAQGFEFTLRVWLRR